VFFIVSFPLLWWGENRQNLAEFVKDAVSVPSTLGVLEVEQNTLIKTSGIISTDQQVNDADFLTGIGKTSAIGLNRDVEMYAWKEKKETKKEGDKEITTYDYVKEWTSMPQNSSDFYDSAAHQNPAMTIEHKTFKVDAAKIGSLTFDVSNTELWNYKKLSIDETLINKNYPKKLQVAGGVIYCPYEPAQSNLNFMPVPTRAVASTPVIGDQRITYMYFPANVNSTVVGAWNGSQIGAHYYDGTDFFLGAFAGTPNEFQAFLQTRHTTITWIIRAASFILMWLGLNMILGPICMLVESIPLVGGAGRSIISLVTGVIAFVLWGITLLLANLWLILAVLAVIGGVVFYFIKRNKTPQAGVA
ncbi:MAG: hypothetical protein HQM16_16705, partial [Deltaproteobacteria bacterium]|nr:hypothetical protein [Deltaproteobacteria bacterium]